MTTLPESPFFKFPLTSSSAAPALPTRISPDEIARFAEISRRIRSVLNTFGSRASGVFNLGDHFRIYVSPEPGPEEPLFSGDSYIPELMVRTADELVANSARAEPRPHAAALTSPFFLEILRGNSSKDPEDRGSISYTDAAGVVHSVPSLSATAFVQPTPPRDRTRTAAMRLRGVTCSARHGLRFLLTEDQLEVSLSPDLEAIMMAHPISVVLDELWFTGTIVQGEDNQWTAAPGGSLARQGELVVQPAPG